MKTLFLFLMTIPSLVFASETDPFTARYLGLPADATDRLNTLIQYQISAALKEIEPTGCDRQKLDSALGARLRRPIYGRVESWVTNPKLRIPHLQVSKDQSVYQDIPFWRTLPMYTPKAGFGSSLVINGSVIGADKLGHFFDEGYTLYSRFKKYKNLQKAMDYSMNTENGFFGKITTGVFSHADTVANFQGMHFWFAVNRPNTLENTSPYFKCKSGQWVQIRAFDFKDYIDPAMDESINCNSYRSKRYKKSVDSQIQKLGMKCPLVYEDCDLIRKKYSGYRASLISSTCKRMPSPRSE